MIREKMIKLPSADFQEKAEENFMIEIYDFKYRVPSFILLHEIFFDDALQSDFSSQNIRVVIGNVQ